MKGEKVKNIIKSKKFIYLVTLFPIIDGFKKFKDI